jgi:hypothetical protein
MKSCPITAPCATPVALEPSQHVQSHKSLGRRNTLSAEMRTADRQAVPERRLPTSCLSPTQNPVQLSSPSPTETVGSAQPPLCSNNVAPCPLAVARFAVRVRVTVKQQSAAKLQSYPMLQCGSEPKRIPISQNF